METEVKKTEESDMAAESSAASARKMGRMKKFHRTMKADKRVVAVAILIVALSILYSYRGLFVAATVNGNPISRLAVIRELEKKSGEQALEALVTKQLIGAAAIRAGVVTDPADVDSEIEKITKQIEGQGGTLALALEQQGMTEEEFRDQIVLQKNLEKILGDKVAVTDEDVASYIAQTKAVIPKGMTDEDFKNQIREQLKGQKFNAEASQWVTDAKTSATINYFVDYALKPVPPVPADAISSDLK